MANRERSVLLRLYVSEDEAKQIKENMLLTGTNNFSLYARKMLLDGYIVRRDFSNLKELVKHLGELARNLHQIAKRANETKNIYAQDVEDVKNAYYKEWAFLKKQLMIYLKETRQGFNGLHKNTPNL